MRTMEKAINQTSNVARIERVAKVWTPDARLFVPVNKDDVVFNFPAFGGGTYDRVVKQVLANRQRLPSGEQDAFMLDAVYNSEDVKSSDEAEFVRNAIMSFSRLWVPVVNVWTPNSIKNPGQYAVFDEKGEGLSRKYTIEELEDKLSGGSTERGVRFSKDRKVTFAPLNMIRAGKHNKGTLAQDGALIANYGIEGVEKLDEVAKCFAGRPYLGIVDNNTKEQIQTLSALTMSQYFGVSRLYVSFDSGGNGRDGYVLSVSGSD